jgi:hypothetical protein
MENMAIPKDLAVRTQVEGEELTPNEGISATGETNEPL